MIESEHHRQSNRARRSLLAGVTLSLLLLVWVVASNPAQATERIVRALFSTGIYQDQPVNRVLIVDDTVASIYFYSEMQNFRGRQLSHRWEHNGRMISRKQFQVGTNRARLSSSVNIAPAQTGVWMVFIEDHRGRPIHAEMFHYGGEALRRHGVVILPLNPG